MSIDIVVIGRQIEEILMEELDVCFCLHNKVRLLFTPFSEERNVAIEDINLITLFRYQLGTVEDAAGTDHRTADDGQQYSLSVRALFSVPNFVLTYPVVFSLFSSVVRISHGAAHLRCRLASRAFCEHVFGLLRHPRGSASHDSSHSSHSAVGIATCAAHSSCHRH